MNWEHELNAHVQLTRHVQGKLEGPFQKLADALVAVVNRGGKIMVCGNGGSAADAQHFAAELVCRFRRHVRRPIAALALTTDTSVLTATGNDLGYDVVFRRQVSALCRPEDAVIGITTSGLSANILWALEIAKQEAAATTAVLCGDHLPWQLRELADHVLMVPSNDTARIQEMHITLLHLLAAHLEESCT